MHFTGTKIQMAVITQHAMVEKRAGEDMFFPFFSPLFVFLLELKAYRDAPHVFCDAE